METHSLGVRVGGFIIMMTIIDEMGYHYQQTKTYTWLVGMMVLLARTQLGHEFLISKDRLVPNLASQG